MAKSSQINIDHEDSLSAMATWWKAAFITPVWAFLAIMPLGLAVRTFAPSLFVLFYILTMLAGLVYFAYDMLKRRIVISERRIHFGFDNLALADLESVKVVNFSPGFGAGVMPKSLRLTFRCEDADREPKDKSFELMYSRLRPEDVQALIDLIGRKVAHCKIDPAVEEVLRYRKPQQIMRLENPDKIEVYYENSRLLPELAAVLHRTGKHWGRLVGPLGTLILCTPIALFFNLQLAQVLRDYSNYAGNAQFYDQLVTFLNLLTPIINQTRTYGFALSDSVAASPVVAVFSIITLFYFYFYLIKALFGANRLTINREEISLDQFFSIFSITIKSAKWSDLARVSLEQPRHSADPNQALIRLTDKKGKVVMTIRLDALAQADRERVSLALGKLGTCEVDSNLTEALEPRSDKSYTELWLKSLSDTPGRKNLEPLASGHLLENSRYEIEAKLAVGGEGIAYLGRDLKSLASGHTERVVLKETLIPPFVDKQVQQSALERFEREARLLKELKSEHIVGLRDYFIEDHRCYLVLDYVEGKNLRQYVAQKGALDQAEVLLLARQMTATLAFLHGQKTAVIHRDFTPDNMMLTEDGKLTLIDFNVARESDDGKTGTIVGKHAYVPPEQFRGKPTRQSDIYALGASLYFLLVGSDPTPISKSAPRSKNAAVSEALDSLIQDCTNLDLSKRLTSIEEVMARLDAVENCNNHDVDQNKNNNDDDDVALTIKIETKETVL
jgi:tRNA A-37 threonylcarbamoyl transferase component Bud32